MSIQLRLRFTVLLAMQALGACSSQKPTADLSDAELGSIASLAQAALPATSKIIATCGPSNGKSYYLKPKQDGWVADQISAGRFVFSEGSSGAPNILFQDAYGKFKDARAEGASVSFLSQDKAFGEFSVAVTYPGSGVSEVYIVSRAPDGQRIAMWTSAKAGGGVSGVMKVAAYVSHCI